MTNERYWELMNQLVLGSIADNFRPCVVTVTVPNSSVEVRINSDDPRTQALVFEAGFLTAVGEARRNPMDKIDQVYGIRKALKRALEQTELPKREKRSIWMQLHEGLRKEGFNA